MDTAAAKSAKADLRAKKSPGRISNQSIYERIYDAISERSIPPGTKLSEEKLAKVFGVSRTRIREVLCRLANEKIVTLIPNRGAFVAQPTVEETRAVFEARRVIEGALIRRLAESATTKDIARLREHVSQEHTARAANDRAALAKLSGDFHLLIAELAANPFLRETLHGLVSLTRLIIYLYDSPRVSACLDHEHDTLVSAIERRDATTAEREMLEHLEHVESSLNLNIRADETIDLEKIFA